MTLVNLNIENNMAILTINNPPVNALNSQITMVLLRHIENLSKNDEVRVLIVTGFGEKFFMAGADIKEFPKFLGKQTGLVREHILSIHKMFNALDNFPKPTIAAVNGLALGGGCELMLACDLRIVADTAKLGFPEVKLGLFPGGGGTQRLPRLVGKSKAKELLYLGEPISAQDAMQIGLVNKVVPLQKLISETIGMGNKIISLPSVALSLIKQSIDKGFQVSLEEGLKIEIDLFDRVFLSEDAREGVNAFIEKKRPEFKHR